MTLRRLLGSNRRQRWNRIRHPAWLGTLRQTEPLSNHWGRDRGTPIDRYYINSFLADNRADIRGRALEIKDSRYIVQFGSGVTSTDILDIDPDNRAATITADISAADAVPDDSFDCVVLTQTLQYIPDPPAAIAQVHRILAPGGVVLATVPATSRIGRAELDTEYWRFLPNACQHLFDAEFGAGGVAVRSYGNLLVAIAFLAGMAREELSGRELDAQDPFFPVIVAVRAQKSVRYHDDPEGPR